MESALVMVLAGGRGKRMGILCERRAKPLLPFAGNNRVIDFTLSNCVHSQLRDVGVITDFGRSSTGRYLRSWFVKNGGCGHMRVLEPGNGSYLGTANAVHQNRGYAEKQGDGLLLVLAGDHVYRMDYRKMLDYHRKMAADATVGVVSVPIEEVGRFGVVTTDGKGRIVEFMEKPAEARSNLVSMGIYVFNQELVMERLMEDAELRDSSHDFGHAIVPEMVRRDRVVAYEFDGYWRDIGNPEAYYEASMELLVPGSSFSLDGVWPILGASGQGSALWKSQEGSVENSVVGPGCTIRGRVENSVLGLGVWVEEEAEIRNSVVMANSLIGYHSVVDHCIVDEAVSVGKFCYLGFGGSSVVNGSKLTVLGEAVTVPSHTAICRGCTVSPYVGPGDFTGKVVPPGSVVSPGKVGGR